MDMQVFTRVPLFLQTGRMTLGIKEEEIKHLILVLRLVGLLSLFKAAKIIVNYVIKLE